MNRSRFAPVIAIAAFAAGAFAQTTSPAKPGEPKPAPAQPPAATPAQPPADPAMDMMMTAAKPGEHHKHLEQLVGEWDGLVKMFIPGAPETQAKTSCSSKMEFEGRYLYSHHSGDFGGMPFKGVGVLGYNNVTKRYENSWIDNMSTGVEYGTGQCSADGKVFTINSEMTDPMQGKKIPTREVTTIVDADHYTMEFYQAGPDGKEAMTMEISFSRKTAAAAPARLNKPSVKIQSTAPTGAKKPTTSPEKK